MTNEATKNVSAPPLSSMLSDLDFRFTLMSTKLQMLELDAARILPNSPHKAEIIATIESLKQTLRNLSDILLSTAQTWERLEGKGANGDLPDL